MKGDAVKKSEVEKDVESEWYDEEKSVTLKCWSQLTTLHFRRHRHMQHCRGTKVGMFLKK